MVLSLVASVVVIVGCERREASSRSEGSPVASGPAVDAATGAPVGANPDAARLAERLRALPRGAAAAPNPSVTTVVAMLGQGQYGEAESLLRPLLHDSPTDSRLQFLIALSIHKQQRYAEARRWYDAVIDDAAAFPEVDQLPHFLGWCLFYLGLPAESRAAFEEHLRRVGDEPDSLFGLGLIALEEDRVDEAEAFLLRSIAAIPPNAPGARRDAAKAHVRLGDVYVRLERLDAAEEQLRRGVELFPDHYEGWAKLARLLHRKGETEEAEAAQRNHDDAARRVGRG